MREYAPENWLICIVAFAHVKDEVEVSRLTGLG